MIDNKQVKEWDENTKRWHSIISQKYAAQATGLGTIVRHSLLITPEFGSMVWLGAVLCKQELDCDELKDNSSPLKSLHFQGITPV